MPIIGLAIFAGLAAAQSLPPSAADSTYRMTPLPASDAERLVQDARALLARHASMTAKIRQQTDLFGHRLVGSGVYLQQGTGDQMMSRLELRIRVAGVASSLLEVGDGIVLWTDEQIADQRHVSRINLEQVRAAWNETGRASEMLPGRGLGVGGLSELVAALADNFQFTVLEQGHLTGLPIYALSGHWRPEPLSRMLPKEKDAIAAGKPIDLEKLPQQVPHEVQLILGRDDLFPYLIDFRRLPPAGRSPLPGGSEAQVRSLVRMQLFEVKLGNPIDPRQFVYVPPDNAEVADRTQQYLGQSPFRRAEPDTASPARGAGPFTALPGGTPR